MDGFIEIDITKEIYENAIIYAKEAFSDSENMTKLNSKTFSNNDKLAVFISEAAFESYFKDFTRESCFDYDFINESGQTVDIKSKLRGVVPRISFSGTVPLYQIKQQKCDYYCFCSLTKKDEKHRMWLCGKISKKNYLEKARFWKKGSVDKSNGLVWKSDTLELTYKEMGGW